MSTQLKPIEEGTTVRWTYCRDEPPPDKWLWGVAGDRTMALDGVQFQVVIDENMLSAWRPIAILEAMDELPVGDPRSYPIGSRALAAGGGHWTKTGSGWKWCNGSTFPTFGGEAVAVFVPTSPPSDTHRPEDEQ